MILYINGNYPNHSLHSELVYKLAERGNDITVFVPMRGKGHEGLYPCEHPRVKIIYSDCLNYIDRVLFLPKVKKIARIIEEQVDMSKVDCMLAGTVYSDGAVAFLLYQEYQIPFSVAVRGTDVSFQMRYRPYLNGYIRNLLSQATTIIFLTPAFIKHFEKFGINQAKYSLILNAVNDYWFKQQQHSRILHDPKSLIFVGEITKNKNVRTIISVVNELNRRNIKTQFHIVGSGPKEKECRSLVEKYNLQNQVFFYGWQKGKEKIKFFYDQSDIFVMLSYSESFGTVYVEALSQGIPIIYTKGQGIDGYFEEGGVGYSCNPVAVNEIADKIVMIMNNYFETSKRCIYESNRFTWDRVADQYNTIIMHMRGK